MANDGLTIDTQALRQKILDLAMRGKLVPQDPNDEPASNLLKKIASEKDQLVKDKKIKRSKKLSPITEDEKPFEIPDSWEWVRIKTLLRPQQKIKPKNIFQYIDIESVDNKKNEIVTPKLINPHKEKVPVRASQLLKNGDVLFSTVRPYLRNIAMVTEEYNDAIGTSGWYVLKTFKQVNSQFIFYVVLSNYVINGLTRHMKGDNSPSIRKSDLETFVIPFPPLAEQSRIAAKVARLFALLRKVESSIQQYTNLKDLLKFKLLDLAMRGKLIDQNPNDEPANVLLDKIKAEKDQLVKEKKIKKTKSLPEIADDEKPFEIPNSWEWVRLGDLVSIKGGKRVPKGKKLVDYQAIRPYIRVTDMKGYTVSTNDLKYVTQDIYDQIKKYTISSNDIYFSIAGTIGKVGKIPDKISGALLTENAAKLTPYDANKDFLIQVLSSNIVKKQHKKILSQVAQPKLSLIKLRQTIIPLPPLSEQRRIVSKLEQLFALIG